MQVCWKPGERVAFTSKAPALGSGLEQSPRLSYTHSPMTPGGKAAGDRGWGRLPELLHSSACPKDRAVKGCLRRGLTLGASGTLSTEREDALGLAFLEQL